MLRGDLTDPKLRLSVGKTPVFYLNHPTDYLQWEISLRRLVTSYNMAESLLFTMPREELAQFMLEAGNANAAAPEPKPEDADKSKSKSEGTKETAKAKAKSAEAKDSPILLPRTAPVNPRLLECSASQKLKTSSSLQQQCLLTL